MVIVKEEAHCRRVRVFRWNEKLRKNRISESEGLLVYFITSKFTTIHRDTDIEIKDDRLRRAIRFDVKGLLSHHSIKSLPHTVLSATKQFLPETILPLGDEISDYLLKNYNFCTKNILGPNLPKIVIVTEIYRIRTVDHTDIDLNLSPIASMSPPTPPRLGYDYDPGSDSDSSGFSDFEIDHDAEKVEDDPYDSYSVDVELYLWIIREFLGEKGYFPTRGVAIDEPIGFVKVEPLQGEEEEFIEGDKCAICLDELTTATRITRTTCSHVFHTRLGEENVGYRHLYFPMLKLSIVGGRPFPCGGGQLF
ncbi:uncharacterized protein LOC132277612 [Cornus florida]|uniref:uncharacterized protein LOC132277612 n=1 Tax=Cornus florida TaxID=4283 RepID=UPI0028A2020C|nr:uncharacterized protein LOC132277612 [Cornus florida]